LKKNQHISSNKIIVLLLVTYSLIQIYCINQLTVNYDEGLFASYGASILKFQRQKDVVLYESKLPITALNLIPRSIEQLFHSHLQKTMQQSVSDIINGRYISLFIAVLLGVLVFKWSKELYDERTALFVLLFYLLCPNFLAHGIFVSSDIFACFFMTLALYCLWKFFKHRRSRDFIFMSIATGLAEISKFSMVHLFILIPMLFIIGLYKTKKDESTQGFSVGKIGKYAILFLFVNWLIICTSHLFYQVFLPIKEYSFIGNGFTGLQSFLVKFMPGFPVPLPSSYIKSMDAVMYFNDLGGGVKGSLNGAPYILGEHNVNGFWYYYFIAIWFKVPVSTLLLWIGAIFFFFRNFCKKTFFTNDVFVILPVIYFLVYLNFFYSAQVGIRHILIIFPLLFILAGKIISAIIALRKQFIIYILLVYQTVSVFSYFPHFLPYTNEFILDKKFAYKKIADTNICYGEGLGFLKKYLAKHPDAVYLPERPVIGKVVLEVNEMLDMNIATVHKYDWAKSLVPVDHINSQYLVFNISDEMADTLKKKLLQ
jgi:hypothetical protein